ncbi:MAG TPA: glycogen-binding domain-containing protein [Gemmatimonadales bacterium]|nr:glycogen-binding domain-containing protein [Gemmatimonadales bacterium]
MPLTLLAQRQVSLGAGAGIVRYTGGSSFSAFTLSPAVQITNNSLYLGGSGGLSLLERGAWASQGRADLWAVLPWRTKTTRLAISSSLGASTRSDGVGAASASAIVEVVRRRYALGAGVVTGVIQGETGVGSFRIRGRGWWQLNKLPTQLSFATEVTQFLGGWYTDFAGGASYDGARTIGSLWLGARMSEIYGSTAAASASLQYFLTPRVAIEASGGSYLRDPFQGLPRAGFAVGGIRVFTSPRAAIATKSQQAALQPLVATHRGGDTVIVRFRMPGAQSVGIAGTWNEWKPRALHPVGGDIWEGALQLPPGTYHFNLIVDGSEWVVPGGVATAPDGMGGLIAVLIVL